MHSDKLNMILATVLFGTIGIFVKYIPVSSSFLALCRGAIGTVFLLCAVLIRGGRLNRKAIWNNRFILIPLGFALGFNWIFLFEAYKNTTVSVATLCYYMAPVFVLLLSPIVLKERLTVRKFVCILVSLLGMALVSGVLTPGLTLSYIGIFYGLLAAVLYCAVILLNKFLRDIPSMDCTVVQLGTSAVILFFYTVFTGAFPSGRLSMTALFLLLFVGIVHTGITYLLYFSALAGLPAQTVALLSYIDPAVAILLSALVLKEAMSPAQAVGAVCILGASIASEFRKTADG